MNERPMDDPRQQAPGGATRRPRGLVRWLYTSNPFYVLSAELFFVGLRVSFNTHGATFETWGLMLGLAGYTLLLATTACALIRLGRVWDDMRSLLLLVVLMFLAMSVTFDDTLAAHPALGVACCVGGLGFAVAVSEGVLRGIGLALPRRFRVPYYAILALFFLYPAALLPLLHQPESSALQWALFGFSPVAGLVFLTLLPAIRRGPDYVAENGSPWVWPLYPWVLFGLLGLAACARSSYLCLSMHFVERSALNASRSSTIFGPYFLVPIVLAAGLLLLELGLERRNRIVLRVALAVPIGMLALALTGRPSDYLTQQFLVHFRVGLGGTPLFVTLLATIAFYAFAAFRGVPSAWGALSVASLALSVVGVDTRGLDYLDSPRPWPFVAVALLQLTLALARRDSSRGLFAAACLVAAATISLPERWSRFDHVVVGYHLTVIALLLIGAVFDDPQGCWSRRAGAVLLLCSSLASLLAGPEAFPGIAVEVVLGYPLAVIAVALVYGTLVREPWFQATARACAGFWLATVGWRGYLVLRQLLAGLDLIVWGLLSFLVAAAISLRKAGGLPKRLTCKTPEREV